MRSPLGRRASLALLATVTLGGSPARAARPAEEPAPKDARELLGRIQRSYTKSPSVTASFVQTYAPAGFAATSPETGRLTLQAPSQLRFDYDGKDGKLFTFDGKTARQYVAQDRQMVEKALSSEDRARLPLLFFEGPDALLARFQASFRAVENGLTEVTLSPKAGGEAMRVVILAGSSGEVKRLEITDSTGNRTTFTFTQQQVGRTRPASDFALVPPKGTRVVSGDGR